MDLTCASSSIVAMPGSLYFAGFCISAAIIPRLSDIYGRQLPLFLCILVQTIAYWFVLHVQDIYQCAAAYLIVGLCAGGRVSIGCQYLSEFVPTQYGSIAITVWHIGDSGIMIYQSLYYANVSKDWLPLHTAQFQVSCAILCCLWMLPESPKYLYASGRYNES
jgi:MFS family permease